MYVSRFFFSGLIVRSRETGVGVFLLGDGVPMLFSETWGDPEGISALGGIPDGFPGLVGIPCELFWDNGSI